LLDMAEPVNPYKGLRAFQESDSDDFFGREALVQKLLDRLQELHPLARFLAVVGPSGSGKSSVVKAGVIPALRKNAIPASDKWFIVEMLPGLHPLDEIESALLKIAVTPPVALSNLLRADEKGLGEAVKRVLPDDAAELLLVIDQFEEVFTQVESENERTHILNSLRAAILDPASRLRVIVTLRADFYDRPLNYEGFGSLMRDRTEVVLPLSAEELQQAIAGPAERVGLLVEPALVAEMVSEIQDEPGALPLLQYALTEVFEKREGITLTLEAYRASGGALGALAHRAEELYQTFNEEQQATTRQIFLRLVTLGEGTEDTRRRVLWAELIAIEGYDDTIMQDVLELYGKYRLLTFGADPQTREPTVEVAHEALIRQWQRLREWLNESRESVRLQRRLIAALSDWQNQGRDASFLASGTRLVQYESLLESTNLALTANEQTYIRASIRARDEKAAAEEARRERELALERQAKRRLRVLLVVMAAALVGAFGLSIFAFNQQREAQQERDNARLARDEAQQERDNAQQSSDEARTQALAASAQILLNNNDTDAALVLAMEAMKIEPDLPAVEPALANAAYTPATRLIMEGHEDVIYVVTYSPDGQTALSGSYDGTMRLWNTETGREIRQFEQDLGWVLGVAYSPDGRQAVAAYDEAQVLILWDLETGQEIRRFNGHTDFILTVAYSPDGKYLAAGGSDNAVLVWDVQTGEIVHQMRHADAVNTVTFSPDGRYLASGSDDETIILWDVETGEQLRIFEGHSTPVISLDFSTDSQLLFSGGDYPNGTPRLWDVETGEQLGAFRGHTDIVTSVALSPDGRYGLSASGDTTIRLWNLATGEEIQRYVGHEGMVYSVAFSPDNRKILSGGDDLVLREWWVENGALVHRLEGHESIVWKAIFSPDGRSIASVSVDETIKLWDAQTGELINELGGDIGEVIAVNFNRDGTQLLSTSNQPDNRVRLWEVATSTEIRQYQGHTGGVNDAVFLPDEKTFLSGDGDGDIILWDVETAEILSIFQTGETVLKIALNRDGTLMASSHIDNSILLWDMTTQRMIRTFAGHTASVYTIEFSADDRYLLSASTDRTARLWEVATGNEVRRFSGNNSAVYGAAFSPDNRYILLGLADGTAILEDAATGNPLRIYRGHYDAIESVAFSPDGKMAVTTSDDATILVWRIDSSLDEIVEWVRANRYLREPTCGERAQYRIDPLCIGEESQ
jgi:WD40 repeat protein